MNRPSKTHHFVPQAQLRHFAADADRRFIYAFDKHLDKPFRPSILSAGSENDFNTVTFADGKWNFEDLFKDVDGRSARLISDIVSRRSVGWLGLDDRIALVDLFATQLLRTHFSRKTPKHLAEQLREVVRRVGYNPDVDPNMAMPSDALLRLGAAKDFLDRGDHVAALLRLVPALYASRDEARFVISDHPVTVINAFPYGEQGLISQGIIVLLPITPELTVALHCPTIVQRYEILEQAELEPEMKARMLQYRDGLRSGAPILVDADAVANLNQGQIRQSWRFLYSAIDDFAFARQYLAVHPEHRRVETHIQIGDMGRTPPRNLRMPNGLQLVVIGPHDHCMLPIDEADVTGEGLTLRTSHVELLEQLVADTGMLCVELYDDGHKVRMINKSMIERFGKPSDGWFRAIHRDPAMRALGAVLEGRLRR